MCWRVSAGVSPSAAGSIALSAGCDQRRFKTRSCPCHFSLSWLSLHADGHLLLVLTWAGSHAPGRTTSPSVRSPTKEVAAETFAYVLRSSTSSRPFAHLNSSFRAGSRTQRPLSPPYKPHPSPPRFDLPHQRQSPAQRTHPPCRPLLAHAPPPPNVRRLTRRFPLTGDCVRGCGDHRARFGCEDPLAEHEGIERGWA